MPPCPQPHRKTATQTDGSNIILTSIKKQLSKIINSFEEEIAIILHKVADRGNVVRPRSGCESLLLREKGDRRRGSPKRT